MPAMETQGVQLKRGNGASPEVFTLVGRIVSFDGPGGSAAEIDSSDLQSTAKEFIMGLPDEGTFSFQFNTDTTNAQQTGLRNDRAARTLRNFQLALTDSPATVLSFAAYVTEFAISGGVGQIIKGKCSLRISGPVTYT